MRGAPYRGTLKIPMILAASLGLIMFITGTTIAITIITINYYYHHYYHYYY